MTTMFRSISFKIFGVSLGLLVMMVVTAVWSTRSSEQVHRQLQTMGQSLFPLSVALGNLKSVVQAQTVTADFYLNTPDQKAVQICVGKAQGQKRAAASLLTAVKRYGARGFEITDLEQNKLAFASLQPMIAELEFQENRLSQMTLGGCALDADAVQMGAAKLQADDVLRLVDTISGEINAFVEASAQRVAESQKTAMQASILMTASAGLVGLMLAWLISRGLTRPIIRLQAGARAVGAGLLEDAHVLVTSRDEVGDVTHAFNNMIVDLREKERIKETFGQYVDPRVVADLIGGGAHSSSGEKQIATLFFSDIIGFSAIAERLAPSTLVDLVNAYFSEMSQPISDNTGIIDKYIGDAIMAFWVPPFVDATKQAELACRAALEQYAKLEAFRLQVPDVIGLRRDIPLIDFRAALSTGEVVVGSVGSETARSFTVMGDTVNQASRLEAANKIYGTRLLIDHETFSRAGRAFETRQIDDIIVLGRLQSIRIYELVSLAGELDPTRRRAFDLYEEALEHYRVAKWDMAEMALQAALELSPNDGPSRTLLARIAQFRRAEPEDWTGVWSMISK
ncbi:MAG: adenylate/guanylate cyclase domain-containing protein [Polymorphobacter sp.]